MKGVTKAARAANGLSRSCSNCPLKKACYPELVKVCSTSFIEGFKKGVKWIEEIKTKNK